MESALAALTHTATQAVYDAYAFAGTPDGALAIWGVFVRCLGVMFAISLGALAWQLVPLAGSNGITPVKDLLAAYRRDFGRSAYLWWPTVFWLSCSDFALTLVPAIGALSGLFMAVTGGMGYSPWLLRTCWACLLSVDNGPNGLVYPWDSFLLEAGFMSTWLPALASTPGDVRMSEMPIPFHALAFRWMTIRLLTGFGKLKFIGSTPKDRFYIHTFCINQPMASPVGWFMNRIAPKFMFVGMLIFMFIVEIPLPLAGFLSGWPRALAGAGIIMLMLGIQVTGNFGYFNILTAVMSIPLLQWNDEPLLARSFDTWQHTALSVALLGFFLPVSWLYWILNSWINVGWTHWPALAKRSPAWLFTGVVRLLRGLASFRVLQAYGVFPPNSAPPQRWAPVYEVTADGSSWSRCIPNYYIADAKCAPRFIAPYHPRFDHAIFYESFAFGAGFLTLLAHHNPTNFTAVGPWVRLQLRLLQAAPSNSLSARARDALSVFQKLPVLTEGHSAQGVRVSFYNFVASSLQHALATGEYYDELYSGTHMPSISADPEVTNALWDSWLPCGPEEYWWEFVYWRRYAERTAKAITPQEYEEAWEFLTFVRSSAAQAATEEAEAVTSGHYTSLSTPTNASDDSAPAPKPRQRRRSPARSQGAATSSEGATPPAAPAAEGSCSTEAVMRYATGPAGTTAEVIEPDADGKLEVVEILRATNVRVLPTASRLAEGAATVNKTSARAPVPVDAANAVFTWAHLPSVHQTISERYTVPERIRIRRTLQRMCIPVLRALERLFWRAAPTDDELQSEIAAAGNLRRPFAGWETMYQRLGDAISGSPVGARGHYEGTDVPAIRPTVSVAGVSHAVHVYADNDDAEWTGAMRNHVRFGMCAHWLMLVGGREAYERAVLSGSAGVVGQRLPTGFTGIGADDSIARASLPELFTSLQTPSHSFAHMATEAGTFLLGAVWYDMFASLIAKTAVMAAQGRPNPNRTPASMEILPGMMEILPRSLVHPELRPSLAIANGPVDISPPLRMRRWRYAADGDWAC